MDFETRTTYRLTVSVSDGADEFGDDDNYAVDDTVDVTITVIDVNEAPQPEESLIRGDRTAPGRRHSFAETARSIDPPRSPATYTATDQDGDTADNYAVDDTGMITVIDNEPLAARQRLSQHAKAIAIYTSPPTRRAAR